MCVGVDVNTGLQASKARVPSAFSDGVNICVYAAARVAAVTPWPVCACLGGAVTCVHTQGGPGLWATPEDAWLGAHCPVGGLFSWCWVDRPQVPGTSE